MKKASYNKVNIIFILATTILIGIGVFSCRESNFISYYANGRATSANLIDNYRLLRTLVTEAETGQRGYLLTGKTSYLAPYLEASAKIPSLFQKIKTQNQGIRDAKTIEIAQALEDAISNKLDELKETIAIKTKRGTNAAIAIVTEDRGRKEMIKIESLVDSLIEGENNLSKTLSVEEEASIKINSTTVLLGLGLVLVIILSTLIVMNIGFKRELVAEEQSDRFANLIENSGDLIAIGGLDRTILYMNRAGRKMLGLEESNLKNNAADFYPEDDGKKMKNEVIPHVLSNRQWTGEIHYQHRETREPIPVSLTAFPLKNTNGEIEGMAVVARDIRDRKKLERDLDRFFEVSLDMMAVANTKGYFLRINPAFTDILGYTAEEFCSRPCIDFIHPDDLVATQREIEKQAGGHAVLSFQNRYRTKNGDYRWFSWKSFPDGEFTYGVARDITEDKKQQALMEKLSEEAIAASRSKSEFLANMSHEIRTPLNGVIGMTTLLLDSSLTKEQLEFAKNIKTSADSLMTVINDILDFSKVEAGKLDIEQVEFNVDTLIDETAKSMSWLTKNKSIPLLVKRGPDFGHQFIGDPGRIRQILMNFVSNAVKFTQSGSITIELKTLAEKSGATEFKFSVTDSGIGIPPAIQAKLFQPFSQADNSTARKFGGTGLGLSICKQLVELMGGKVGLESREGVGSTFWFTLTLKHGAPPIGKTASVRGPTKHAGAQILVAEDNFINQKIILSMLIKMGFNAQAVANGFEVISMLKERSFDLVLMDCQMPELDGYEATRKIRASSQGFASIPILAMTANALKGDKEKCLEAGMNDYASKPISFDLLAELIEKWLDKNQVSKPAA